ncbi:MULTISPECIES: monovalent cation/H+ antiporter complex subunit F [unclassified Streptomyces]|uniref:monovalent cation/H+ antiporter complex subunit F n=1 Tax=unclassified Streptomyces TaxID=2593676 RepID=UPI002DDC7A30|nr:MULTISPECIES: monovalent cation/H+ antiporter complex subunit F [unclassified Streptomyces]WSA95390.1 monovalent cation/H+ antiporter complex subunit F [Streptomyces sp. NBC_01795]WSB79807.1 monovalent cation/H+ antiporter complex subunit F [Streptomyces sp. NBC_01775]WSS11986.1 monovalent cation/H+ antiporter complex subunit F [Streptomyces sp. NBC_01186]WSS40700.1 monovalent cation/H+ antiporter complex subunit F [Streptomyces sp. NBC_01187]
MEVIFAVIAGLLLAAGLMFTLRLALGPTTLDRAVALDALISVVMAGIGVQTAVRHNAFYLPALLVLSFLGFTGSVGVARFMALRDEAGTEDVDDSEETGEANGAAGSAESGPAGGRTGEAR